MKLLRVYVSLKEREIVSYVAHARIKVLPDARELSGMI